MRARRGVHAGVSMLSAVLLLALVAGCGTQPSPATRGGESRGVSPVPTDQLTALAGRVLETPAPVTGADGVEHIAYELSLTNPYSLYVTVQRVEILDNRGRVIRTIEGAAVADLLTVFAADAAAPARFGPGQAGVMILDATADRRVPSSLSHRISVLVETSPGVPFPNINNVLATTFETGQTKVLDRRPVVVSPPLRGEHWWDGVGCCAVRSAHRGAVLAVNGAFHVPERYAIDFVQLTDDGRLFVGPIAQLSSWAFYGAPVYAVADGKVVNALDGLPDQVPGTPPQNISAAEAGGNYIVQDIGNGNYAFYAHLIPGSLKFQVGDRIRKGEVLGLLGNSGNSDAPHLHFHIMDGPAPLASNGLPYEFDRFVGEGVVTNPAEVAAGGEALIDDSTLTGRTRRALPLDQQVVTFNE